MHGRIPSIVLAGALLLNVAAGGAQAAQAAPRDVGRQAPLALLIRTRPTSGPGGALVVVKGTGFNSGRCFIIISFTDANGVYTYLKTLRLQPSFKTTVEIPTSAGVGPGTIKAVQWLFLFGTCIQDSSATATFTVTP